MEEWLRLYEENRHSLSYFLHRKPNDVRSPHSKARLDKDYQDCKARPQRHHCFFIYQAPPSHQPFNRCVSQGPKLQALGDILLGLVLGLLRRF